MGIGRDSRHKRRLTGGRMPVHKKKRAYEKARPVANTKLTDKPRVRPVRVRGGNYKYRALRLREGNFNWASESTTRKTRILDIIYNASNNELVRTKTLVKNCIVQIDATPFKTWYNAHYGV
jgi:small subunit ribosomal protein S8e